MQQDNGTQEWKILDSEYIIRRPWLTARRDTVMLPNGQMNDEYYVLEYPTGINVIAIDTEGNFIMERQYRHGLGRMSVEIPAGVAEQGESPLEAAKRELLEETGYESPCWQLQAILSPNPATSTNYTYCFLATEARKVSAQHLDRTEDITIELMTPRQVRTLLEEGQIIQALMAAPLWRYFALNPI